MQLQVFLLSKNQYHVSMSSSGGSPETNISAQMLTFLILFICIAAMVSNNVHFVNGVIKY